MSANIRKYKQFSPWFAGLSIFIGLYLISLQNYTFFHSLIEIFTIIVAFSIFIIAWNTRHLQENDFFLFLGIAYFFVGAFELLHTLSYKGMGVFPDHHDNLPTQLWICARYLESCSLLIAPLFFRKKLLLSYAVTAYTLLSAALIWTIFYWHIFPDCFMEGHGLTRFKIYSEYIICLLLLLATAHLIHHRRRTGPTTLKFILAALFFTIFAEISFTHYVSSFGPFNLLGHYLTLLSFYCLYKALIRSGLTIPTELLFHNLEEQSELYHDLYDNAPVMYVSCDSRDFKITKCNLTTAASLGYSRDEIIGRQIIELYHPDCEEKIKKLLAMFFENGAVPETELQLIRKDGIPLDVSAEMSAVRNKRGKIIFTRTIWHDITARKQSEKDLRNALRRLRDTNAELSQFNYAIAHDLKAPIRAISNYSTFLLDDLSRLAPKESLNHLRQLKQTTVETGKLIDDLLILAKIGKPKQELEEIDLGTFMEKLVTAMDLPADIDVRLESRWSKILSDPLLLRQIFQNLIDNARKYNTSADKYIEIGCLPHREELTIFVRDNGLGIKAAYHEQIFGLFERLHTSEEYSGTGTGLAIVKKAVNKLGGRIRLESAEGQGTTFFVTLPYATNAAGNAINIKTK